MDLTLIVVLVIALALFFDFTNGFHDTANAMATPIATGALKPKVAVDHRRDPEPRRRVPLDRGGDDHLGRHHQRGRRRGADHPRAHLRGPHRRDRVEHGHVAARPAVVVEPRALRRPHRRRDRRLRRAGDRLQRRPLEGRSCRRSSRRSPPASSPTRRRSSPTRSPGATTASPTDATASGTRQIFSSSLVALAHGTNDAQKTMGVITLTLVSAGLQPARQRAVQTWVIVDVRHRDRARHVHGRLAHHQDPRHRPHRHQARAGLRRRDVDGRDDPRLHPPRLRPLDHAGRLGLGHRVGPRAAAARRCAGARPAASASAGCSRSPRPASSARSRRSSRTIGVDRHRHRHDRRRRGHRRASSCGRAAARSRRRTS